MMIAVLGNDAQWNEIMAGSNGELFTRVAALQQDEAGIDAYIILELTSIEQLNKFTKPVLLNSVIDTLAELKTGKNIVRINGWNGFLSRQTWEIAGVISDEVKNVFTALNKQYIEVGDEPGFVAVRTIAMIINEAYFALGEEVSTKAEIDTAMKLGTNYPYGPFEWAEKIGVHHIHALLDVLSKTDKRYSPAPLLHKEATA